MKSTLADFRLFLVLSFISIFLLLLDNLNMLNIFKSSAQQLTSPIQIGLYRTGQNIKEQFSLIIMARRASQENSALKEQLASLLSENTHLRTSLATFQAEAAQKLSLNPQTFQTISARPIGLSRYLLIDRGTEDGIQTGMPVVFKDSYIGTIKDADPKKSTVLLSSDPDSKIAILVSNPEGKAKGILIGQFGSELLLDKILHQEPISVGDLVYTEGSEDKLPKGLILGTVSEVLSKDNEVFKQAKVKPVFNADDLEIVFIITN